MNDIIAVAREVLAFEARLDGVTVEEVLQAAVEAALLKYDRMARLALAARAIKLAEEIDEGEDDDLACDGPASLLWFARELQESIPAEDRPGFA